MKLIMELVMSTFLERSVPVIENHLPWIATEAVALTAAMPLISFVRKVERFVSVGLLSPHRLPYWHERPAQDIINWVVYRDWPFSEPLSTLMRGSTIIVGSTILSSVAAHVAIQLFRKAQQPSSLWGRIVKWYY